MSHCISNSKGRLGGVLSRNLGSLFAAVLFTLSPGRPAQAADPLIHQLTPREVSRGEVLTIVGENFGSQQGSRDVVYSPKIDGHRRPGSTRMRVVDWSDTTILVQVPLNLERAESYAVWVDVPHTNFMSFTLRSPAPPAVAAGGPRRPWLDRVHPGVGRPGGEVDVYGDFNKPPEASPRVILVNRHGVPVERILQTSIWTDRRIRITVPEGIMGDDYQVFVRWVNMIVAPPEPGQRATGHTRAVESNRLQLVVRTTDERRWERGNPRILAIEPAGVINAGGVVDILGEDFGAQGRKHIVITPYRYQPLDGDGASPPVMQIISWSNTTIRARLPANLQSAQHYVFIYWGLDYEDRSNTKSVQIEATGSGAGGGAGILPQGQRRRQPAPPAQSASDTRRNPPPPAQAAGRGPRPNAVPFVTNSGMMIERVSFQRQAGSRILVLGGRRFGTVQGSKFVSLNRNGTRHTAQVIAWGDDEVRVRVPANLPAGEYRVLVYYDNSLVTSSNSLQITLGDAGPPVVRRPPPPPARPGRPR